MSPCVGAGTARRCLVVKAAATGDGAANCPNPRPLRIFRMFLEKGQTRIYMTRMKRRGQSPRPAFGPCCVQIRTLPIAAAGVQRPAVRPVEAPGDRQHQSATAAGLRCYVAGADDGGCVKVEGQQAKAGVGPLGSRRTKSKAHAPCRAPRWSLIGIGDSDISASGPIQDR